jgi:TIR domain/Sel1 repeat
MAGKIFINYRRDDSASHALNVAQYLERMFGTRNVFIDIDRIAAGENFHSVLERRLARCKVMLTVVGPGWLDARSDEGLRRIDDPDDWVRLEIVRALDRGIVVIPVLVAGATLPRKSDLPDDMRPLIQHQAAVIGTNTFRNDMAGLVRDIRKVQWGRRWGRVATAAAIAAIVMGIGAYQFGIPWRQTAIFTRNTEPARKNEAATKTAEDARAKEVTEPPASYTAEKAASVNKVNEEAERNAADCESLVGDSIHREGRPIVKIDGAKAVPVCEAAVRANPASPRLRYSLGRAYQAQLDWPAARRSYELASKDGYALAILGLGIMHFTGLGHLPKDERKGVEQVKQAAEKGEPVAMAVLASLYAAGRGGLNKDEYEAVRLSRQAADQGVALGMAVLGTMYTRGGGGLKKDEREGLRLLRQAADEGNPSGMVNLAKYYDSGLAGLSRDPVEAARLVYTAVSYDVSLVDPLISNSAGLSLEVRKRLQERLRDAGLYRGPIDGVFGDGVRVALEELGKHGGR